MIKRILSGVILLFILVAIGLAHGRWLGYDLKKSNAATATVALQAAARQIYPDSWRLEALSESKFAAYGEDGHLLGNLLYSSPAADAVSGFGGRVPLLIAVNSQGIIIDLVMLPNGETPDYVERVQNNGFLKLWNGMELAMAADKEIDAVSGATLTSNAVKNTLKATLQNELNGKAATVKADYATWLKNLMLVIILGLALYTFRHPQKTAKLRLVILGLSLFVLGIWQGTMLSTTTFAIWLVNGIPLYAQWGLAVVFAVALVVPMFSGKPFYCYYVCPFGAAQELVGHFSKRKAAISPKVLKILFHTRRIMLLAVMMVLLLGAGTDVSFMEPFSAFRPQSASLAAVVIAVVSLILSLFISRPWCRFGCPCGEFLDLGRKTKA